jgi:hypothetical protein
MRSAAEVVRKRARIEADTLGLRPLDQAIQEMSGDNETLPS